MEIQIGVSKIRKYATSESGDTLEFIERPGGGISVVLADGQRSGKNAKRISNKVAGKVVSLLSEGIRDGAAARAVSDFLYHERGGKVMSTLNIISADFISNTIVLTRNNPAPILIGRGQQVEVMDEACIAIGTRLGTRPSIAQMPIEAGLTILVFTDGLNHAGERSGKPINLTTCFQSLLSENGPSAQEIADGLLKTALALEKNRPGDDISIVVFQVLAQAKDLIRRVSLSLPLDS
ncbi:MAG TPA: SpoIIE family protein phosphatase [Anaerolineales bacterium]|nr:SpoIIE family protein phosphatase [Anaerolineales bacterium]